VSRQVRGTSFEFFTPLGGEAPKQDLLDGVDISWNKISGGAAITATIDAIINSYNVQKPELSVKPL
jgi:hypothetical protein